MDEHFGRRRDERERERKRRKGPQFSYLIRPVEEADAVPDPQRVDIVGQAALGELVRLDAIQAHDRLRHDAAVPVSAVAFIA